MKFSILTTSYNYEKYIEETIQSVLSQTYADFEYIIIDDCSNDNSVEIIKKYMEKDNRIKLYTHDKNQGLISTFAEGIKKCSGNYIIFVESDDKIEPNYIEEKIKAIKKYPDAAVIFNQVNPVGDEKRVEACKKHLEKTRCLIESDKFDYYELFLNNIIPTFSCVMIKKDIILSIPLEFPVQKCFDWYLWNYIIQNYQVVFLDKVLTTFRLHNDSMSVKKDSKPVYKSLLSLSKRKYKNEFIYKMFESYKNLVKFEKFFRPFCAKFDRVIYKKLYVQKNVNVIKTK